MKTAADIPEGLQPYQGAGNGDPVVVMHRGTLMRGKAEGVTFASDGARVHVKLKGGKRLTLRRSEVLSKRATP